MTETCHNRKSVFSGLATVPLDPSIVHMISFAQKLKLSTKRARLYVNEAALLAKKRVQSVFSIRTLVDK